MTFSYRDLFVFWIGFLLAQAIDDFIAGRVKIGSAGVALAALAFVMMQLSPSSAKPFVDR